MPVNVTVNAVSPHVQYVADGTQTEFGFPFAIFSATDLEVYLDHVLLTEGFSIAINLQSLGSASGGTVTFSQPPVAGTKITLRRQIVVQRTTNFQESGELRARALNYELDYLTAALQQVEDTSDRTIHLHPTDPDANLTLPSKTERAGKALTFDADGDLTVGSLSSNKVSIQTLDDVPAGAVNRHFTVGDETKLDGIADGADANPPAATDPEIAAGSQTAARTFSPAQVKAAAAAHAPVTSVAGRIGAIGLTQADVAGTVPTSRQLVTSAGLTGGGTLSSDLTIGVALLPAGGIAGTASFVARADHLHPIATDASDGLLAAGDKAKLDGIADGADTNPPAATDEEIATGVETAARTLSPAQIKAAVAAHAPAAPAASVTSVAGRTGAISLTQADVAGTVPTSRQLVTGAGLTGGGALSADLTIGLALAPAGGIAGTASVVARADHLHPIATDASDGLLAAGDKAKLDGIADGADTNPPAATDEEIATGVETAARTLSPAQIKAAVAAHAPVASVTSVAGRTGAISLTQADVSGTVPTSRQLVTGSGLTGGGALSADLTIGLALAPAGGMAGTASSVARSDHSHAVATPVVDGLLAATDKLKLDSIALGAQVNPANLDGVPDSTSRLAMTADERAKLVTVSANADANPPAATDSEIAAGSQTAARTVSPAQIKAAVATHAPVAPVTSVAGRTGAISLTQADVSGTVPATRRVAVGAGLVGGGDLSVDRTLSVALATPTGGTVGSATSVARSDHSHGVATQAANGLLAATDKLKLDSIALGAQVNPANLDGVPDSTSRLAMTADERAKLVTVSTNADANPPAATDSEIAAGSQTSARTLSPAQIKAAVAAHAPVAPVTSVAGRTGAVSLSQADVPGTVPASRQLITGAGLTGGGTLSTDLTIGVALAPAGGTAGEATSVARSDHAHALATPATAGLLSASDKSKLDGISNLTRIDLLGEFAGGTGFASTATVANARVPLGGVGKSVKQLDLSNLASFQVVIFTAASYTNVYLGAEFSNNGGASWVSSDGSLVANTAFPIGGAVQLNVAAGIPASGTISIPNGWATASTLVRWSLWHVAGGTAVTVTHLSALSNTTMTIPGITADTEWRTHGVLVGGTVTPTTTNKLSGESGALQNLQGSPYLSNTSVSLTGTPQIQLFLTTSSIVPGCCAGIVFTVDGGTTWVWPDGSLLDATTPHLNGDSNTIELVAAPGEPQTRVLNVVSSLQVSNVRCRAVLYDKLTTGSRAINHVEIRIQRAAVLGRNVTFKGRSGEIVPTAGDYSADQITDATDGSKVIMTGAERTALAAKAPLNSPVLTGTPMAPTAPAGTNTTQLATTAFVQAAVGGSQQANVVDYEDTFLGVPASSQIIGLHVSVGAWTLPSGLMNSVAYALQPPTNGVILSILKNGSPIGSITFSPESNVGVIAGSATSFARGDVLSLQMPGSVYGISGISYVITGMVP